ncbi:MAG: tetratricopeptide repeat protein [Candidatus Wallbacteria bacterium]|nr:tetratricopeptide repeat protein [Candidatus Wallbacteria bacterium]
MKKYILLLYLVATLFILASCNQDVKETSDYLYSRAKFYEYQGNDVLAISKIEKALEKDPNNVEMLFRLGGLYTRKGMYVKAEAAYSKILAADAKNYKAYICMGNLSYYREKYNDAVAYWKKAVEINPDLKREYITDYDSIGMNVVMQPYSVVENDKWKEDAGVTKIDSTMSRAYGVLGEMYFNRGLYDEAVKEWERVIKMAPGSFESKQAEENIKEAKKRIKK